MITAAKNTGGAVTLVTTAETAICTTTQPNASDLPKIGYSPGKAVCWGLINLTPGTGTTGVVVRVRAGTGTGGALVGDADPINVTAGAPTVIVFSEIDEGVELPGGNYVYTVTLAQTGATGNGTVSDAILCVDAAITAQ